MSSFTTIYNKTQSYFRVWKKRMFLKPLLQATLRPYTWYTISRISRREYHYFFLSFLCLFLKKISIHSFIFSFGEILFVCKSSWYTKSVVYKRKYGKTTIMCNDHFQTWAMIILLIIFLYSHSCWWMMYQRKKIIVLLYLINRPQLYNTLLMITY